MCYSVNSPKQTHVFKCGVVQRTNILKYTHLKKTWTALSNVINYSTPNSEHMRRDIHV